MIFPRLLILVLYFLTNWFAGMFDAILWPVVGFLFAPFTLLWYSVVVNYFHGEWSLIPIIGMVIAIASDFGGIGSANRHRRSWF